MKIGGTILLDESDSFSIAGITYNAVLDGTFVMEFPNEIVPNNYQEKLTYNCYVLNCSDVDVRFINRRAVRSFSRKCLPEAKFYVHPTKVLIRKFEDSDFEIEDVQSLSEVLNNKKYKQVILLQLRPDKS